MPPMPPPMRFVMPRMRRLNRAYMMMTGSSHVTTKVTMGLACSTISVLYSTPCASSRSFIVIRNVGDIAGVVQPLLRRRLLGLVARQDDHAVGLELQLGDLVLVEIRLELVIGDLRQIRVGNGRIERIDKQRRDQRRDHQNMIRLPCRPSSPFCGLLSCGFLFWGRYSETHLPSVKTWEVLVGNFLLQILSHSPRI